MALVESLLTAIMRADGDALVMHVGEKPYVVASAGPIELSTQGLNLQAMAGMTTQLLPPESQRALTEFGAVEHEIPARPIMQGDRFTVVVARGGDDVWIELRRHRRPIPVAAPIPEPARVEVAQAAVVEPEPEQQIVPAVLASSTEAVAEIAPEATQEADAVAQVPVDEKPVLESVESAPEVREPAAAVIEATAPPVSAVEIVSEVSAPAILPPQVEQPTAELAHTPAQLEQPSSDFQEPVAELDPGSPQAIVEPAALTVDAAVLIAEPAALVSEPSPVVTEVVQVHYQAEAEPQAALMPEPAPEPIPVYQDQVHREFSDVVAPVAAAEAESVAAVPNAEPSFVEDSKEPTPVTSYAASQPVPAVEWTPEPAPHVDVIAVAAQQTDAYATEHVLQPAASITPEIEPEMQATEQPTYEAPPVANTVTSFSTAAAVIPMTRTLRIEVPPTTPPRKTPPPSEIERLLAVAASRAATALYLTTQASPFIRIDADVRLLEGEPPLSSSDIETAVLQLVPEESREVVRRGEPFEWTSELADIGPIRCSTFRDHRGPGAIFQFISMRPMAAEQLGIAAEIQALTSESDGLVLVSSARGNGKSTIVGSLIDLINRQRPTYIITLERQIRVVHEHRNALISQREVRGTSAELLTIARSALRENPDVLVIEDLASADMFQLALDAAGTGVLVFVSVTAASTAAALTRLVDLFPAERRRGTQALIAERLRGSVTQALLRKTGGGRIAAREVVLTTSAITKVLADGQLSDLPSAIESGRKHGLVSLTDALVQLVRDGAIDLREAYRKADDRAALLAAMKRENLDTSLLERLA